MLTWRAAEQVAGDLLRDHLNLSQRITLKLRGFFDVQANGWDFRVYVQPRIKVRLLKAGAGADKFDDSTMRLLRAKARPDYTYCVYLVRPGSKLTYGSQIIYQGTPSGLPPSDRALAMKLHIEADPVKFVMTAG